MQIILSFLLGLAACQVPKPPHHPPKPKPLPSWKVLKRTNGNFQGLVRPRACPHPSSDPHLHHQHHHHHHPDASSLPVPPPPNWIQREGEQLEGEVQLEKVQPDASRAP
ncbi:hypothetical protein NQZ68_014818 [Dissostichus eleginoides]|nr:hypothetical protein NQZ68_014818 [Dissostichus eleginoides]